MATTFLIQNGDVTMSSTTGAPNLVGNPIVDGVVQTNPTAALAKLEQDITRCLSLASEPTGTTANIRSIIGTVPQTGAMAVALMVNRQIRDMFASVIKAQSLRPNVRPPSEKLKSITTLQVYPSSTNDGTSFGFQMSFRTQTNGVISLQSAFGGNS